MAFLRKEKCFWSAPVNEGSDGTYKVAATITQFAGGSTKYFGTYPAEFPSLREIQPENRTVSMDKCHLSSAPMPELQ